MQFAQAGAKAFDELTENVRREFDRASQLRERGRALLQQLKLGIGGDPDKFGANAAQLQGIIADLNTIDPTTLVAGAGISETQINWTDSAIQHIRAGYDKVMAAKIATGEVLHVDASLIRADVSWESCGQPWVFGDESTIR